ncbi:MAG: PspA/IM30 family protein [Sphaerochaetaceae bacterium]|nr:PspA/IM30 family protein [Sphaerochaetaceae bacterium]MDD4006383.1 PspA/IM30 family protein [Sphaerochaetaceae bacterium]MDD4396253.1 PspA/IM30 family protein [Sphaerochaetaceae bacterium]
MGVFSRFMDIVNANINSMLDKAEDPEKTIKLMLQEIEDTLIEMKSSCAAKMARRAKTHRAIEEQQALSDRWQSRAELAVNKGFDDLAREALIEKKNADEELSKLKAEQARCDDLIQLSKNDIVKLEDKLGAVKLKYQSILEKAQRAREEQKANEAFREASESETLKRFRDMEDRIDRMNADNDMNRTAPASKSTEEKFKDLEDSADIEKELDELRRKSGK